MRDARPPWASKFFRFHAVFGKIWRVHAPLEGSRPPLGKILDPPLAFEIVVYILYYKYYIAAFALKLTLHIHTYEFKLTLLLSL